MRIPQRNPMRIPQMPPDRAPRFGAAYCVRIPDVVVSDLGNVLWPVADMPRRTRWSAAAQNLPPALQKKTGHQGQTCGPDCDRL